jgi:hypothetical protein
VINVKITQKNSLNEIDFPDPDTALIGLHSCGDLTPNVIRSFVKGKNFKKLAIVSCCYHKMMDMKTMSVGFELDYSLGFLRLASERRGLVFVNGVDLEVDRVYEKNFIKSQSQEV